ncbi:hypothetical protein J7E93_11300 [Streptomyces sp. ISL-36]|uniref:hypothetical protein n=1 Tax=Streptomyces sp. ISL-36 TaxID=2819182 RepID=UPI001BE56395|nr:hypothetical protein [Streptomyces sp. ISL-36]MBT2440682.1 hypothetical protein [Streptomyces sp. ISL-36]
MRPFDLSPFDLKALDLHPLRTAAEAASTVPAEAVSDSGPSALALGLGAAALAGAIGTAVVRNRLSRTADPSSTRERGAGSPPDGSES